MRIIILLAWLLVPLPVIAYHMGPGQTRIIMDQVSDELALADQAVVDGEYLKAVEGYDTALELLPTEYVGEARRIRLERAKAQMFVSQLPLAHGDLRDLVDEMRDDEDRNEDLFREARNAYANSQYYMTWLMRLEGVSRDRWEPEIQGARQTLVALVEQAEEQGNEELAETYREDLESSIRLARMSLDDLQGLPLPSQ